MAPYPILLSFRKGSFLPRLPLCDGSHPTFPPFDSLHLGAHVGAVGPPPSDQLKKMADPLSPSECRRP